jgi:hypothetical protein
VRIYSHRELRQSFCILNGQGIAPIYRDQLLIEAKAAGLGAQSTPHDFTPISRMRQRKTLRNATISGGVKGLLLN